MENYVNPHLIIMAKQKSTYNGNFCKGKIYYENKNIKYDVRYIKIGYTIKRSSMEYDKFGKIVTH